MDSAHANGTQNRRRDRQRQSRKASWSRNRFFRRNAAHFRVRNCGAPIKKANEAISQPLPAL